MPSRPYQGVGLPHGITRFNWLCHCIDPIGYEYPPLLEKVGGASFGEVIASASHSKLSEEAEKAFKAGDRNAIFEYAADDRECLHAEWVRNELILWRVTNTTESYREFMRFVRAYWAKRGRRVGLTTVKAVERDVKLYEWMHQQRAKTGAQDKAIRADAVRRFSMSSGNVRKVWDHYEQHRKCMAETLRHDPPEFIEWLWLAFKNLKARLPTKSMRLKGP